MATLSDWAKQEFPHLQGLPVDLCIFTVATKQRMSYVEHLDKRSLKSLPKRYLELLLVQRRDEPFQDRWALPGGFTAIATETLNDAAMRELKEETNLDATIAGDEPESKDMIYLEQMRAYYRPDRDPRGFIPTIAFVSLVNEAKLPGLRAGGDARQARLFRVIWEASRSVRFESEDGAIALVDTDLAFDHAEIIRDAIAFVQHKMMTTLVAAKLLPEEFTIAELQQVISAVVPTYAPSTTNFARDLVKTKSRDGMIEEVLDEAGNLKKSIRYSARPAQLYRFRSEFEPRVSIYPGF